MFILKFVGNKPVFKCELCPATCGRKTDLRIHVQKLHTSESPLKCKRCGKTYPDRYTFKVPKTFNCFTCYYYYCAIIYKNACIIFFSFSFTVRLTMEKNVLNAICVHTRLHLSVTWNLIC